MIGRRDPFEGHDPFRLQVFVPAIMSAGLLFSLLTLLRDALAGRGRHGPERRATTAAAAIAEDVGQRPAAPGDIGLRPRRFYLLVAIGGGAGAIYLAVGAFLNYAREGGYVSRLAWLLGGSLLVAVLAASAAGVAATLWWRWPAPPRWARRAITETPLGAEPGSEAAAGGGGADPVLGAAVTVTAGAFALLALAVGSARASFASADERWLERVQDLDLTGSIAWADELGSTPVAITLALLVGASTLRCRVFAAAWVLAVVGAYGIDAAMKALVERPRPPLGGPTVLVDSFPSGHTVQAVLLAMAMPLAVRVATGRRWPGVALGALVGAGAAVTAVARLEAGSHWPTDIVGGVLLGLAAGAVLRWAVGHESWHRGCAGCPWKAAAEPAQEAHRRPVVHPPMVALGPAQAAGLRLLAVAWEVLVLGGLLLVAWAGTGLPRDPEGEGSLAQLEEPVQLALVGLAVLGTLVALRWTAGGATVVALAAIGLGLVASVGHPVWVVLGITIAVGVPAVLLWLSWQHDRPAHRLRGLALLATVLLVGEATLATRTYDHFFGPAHPESATEAVPADLVQWAWSGDLRPDGFTVVARLGDIEPGEPVELLVAADGGEASTAAVAPADADRIVRLEAHRLEPGTRYRWQVAVAGQGDDARGTGTTSTAPAGPTSFTLAAGSCARTGSNGAVFDAIREADPLLYLATGDLHYANLAATSPGPFLDAYRRALTAPSQSALYRSVPVDYVWDDHDYGPNDADASSPSRDAARAAYRTAVPHPSLPAEGAIYHAFTLGRVRVVVTDTRSERTPSSMLGAEQLAWLIDELTRADRWGLVIWVNPDPWIAPADPARDDWGAFPDERQEIADAIAAAEVDNLVMLSGDAHMVAIDDGTNTAFARDGYPGFPLLHAAALDRPGNVKGGPYSEGAFPGAGQYGLIHVDDDGERVVVELEGKTWTGEVLAHLRVEIG